jgi:hypothetical protein
MGMPMYSWTDPLTKGYSKVSRNSSFRNSFGSARCLVISKSWRNWIVGCSVGDSVSVCSCLLHRAEVVTLKRKEKGKAGLTAWCTYSALSVDSIIQPEEAEGVVCLPDCGWQERVNLVLCCGMTWPVSDEQGDGVGCVYRGRIRGLWPAGRDHGMRHRAWDMFAVSYTRVHHVYTVLRAWDTNCEIWLA